MQVSSNTRKRWFGLVEQKGDEYYLQFQQQRYMAVDEMIDFLVACLRRLS